MTVVLRDALSVDAGLEVDVGCALYLMSVADLFLSRIYSTRSMFLSLGGISLGSKYLPLPSTGITNTIIWTALMSSWIIMLCREYPVGTVSFNVIRVNAKVR